MQQTVKQQVMVIGKESTGKSLVSAALTGKIPRNENYKGSTVSCDVYEGEMLRIIDTPGVLLQGDTVNAALTIKTLSENDTVILVIRATSMDRDLKDLLPLVSGKKGMVLITYWDKLSSGQNLQSHMQRLSEETGVPVLGVDSRNLSEAEKEKIVALLGSAREFSKEHGNFDLPLTVQAPETILEAPWIGRFLALLLLVLPAAVSVWGANTLAGSIEPRVAAVIGILAGNLDFLPSLLYEILAGKYGLITMGPLLFVWAVPTVVIYSFLLGIYKTSGLIDRITGALHPLVRPFGITGRDVIRFIMGYGCNVPAVINTRACSACTRSHTIHAIAFGAACSYQMGATLAVFAAADRPELVFPYILLLLSTTLVYLRLQAKPEACERKDALIDDELNYLEFPRLLQVWREARGNLLQFFFKAMPIFVVITLLASLLNWLGIINSLSELLGPIMSCFRLPAEAALPVVMASIRKDGILLFAQQETQQTMSAVQLLTAVYLAGVLLPCLVTVITMIREKSVLFAAKLCLMQAGTAVVFSVILAWGGSWIARMK